MSAARRPRSKEARQVVSRIRNTCPDAVIESTERGHLKVTGPGGIAVIPVKYGSPRSYGNMRTALARHAGIRLAA